MSKPLRLGSRPLSGDDVISVARSARSVHLTKVARKRIAQNRTTLQYALSGGEALYGVNTGFGKLARTRITGQDLIKLQLNLVRSHAAGTGPELSSDVVRSALLLRAASLSHGYSGVRVNSVETLLKVLNRDILPVVPSRGSVGASGDLAPLAHMALALLGEGHVMFRGRRTTAKRALKSARIKPLQLTEKEGLAFINGTQVLTSVGLITLWDAYALWETALVAGALSTEAIKGSDVSFHERFAEIRPHPGHRLAAARLRAYLKGSPIRKSHVNCDRVQDPYSFRCQPQVMGAVRDALDYVRDILLREINSVTDNPIVDTQTGGVLSGGNFHGQPVAIALDHLTLALTTLANISERRTAALMDSGGSGLPAFLAANPGRDSGLMIWQVTAAALASENKTASTPSSADTIPTSANQEDFVCMGMGAALKAAEALDRSRKVVAVELLADRFALEYHRPLRPGRRLMPFIDHLESAVGRVRTDRNFQPDYAAVLDLVETEFRGSLPQNRW
jgi:histidine ammonia-lyase